MSKMYEWHLLIPADDRKPLRFVKIGLTHGNHLNLNDLHDALNCSWIENVACRDGFMLLVDEVGKCYDKPKPVNSRASIFYLGSYYGDVIVGDALIGHRAIRVVDDDPVFDFCPLTPVLFAGICRLLNEDPKKVLKCAK